MIDFVIVSLEGITHDQKIAAVAGDPKSQAATCS
jgi:hypothetical protein